MLIGHFSELRHRKGGLVRCVSTWILFHNEWWDCIIYLWWLSRGLWIRKLETYEVLTLRRKTYLEGTLLVTVSQKNKPENDWGIFCKYILHLTNLANRIFISVCAYMYVSKFHDWEHSSYCQIIMAVNWSSHNSSIKKQESSGSELCSNSFGKSMTNSN